MTLALYAWYSDKYGTAYGQTIAFVALVAIQWANAFNARSTFESLFSRIRVWHGAFWGGLTIAISLQALALFGPLQSLLHIHPVALGDMFIATLIAFAVAIIPVEIHKYIGRRVILNKDTEN